MPTITVRQAMPEDATELARMLDLFDRMGATPEQVAARILACQPVLTTFIGELDGRPVGFACLRLIPHLQGDEPYAELTDIYVDASFRRHGVARALIAQVEAAAQAAGAGGLVIITGFDNEAAQATYRASGYAWPDQRRQRGGSDRRGGLGGCARHQDRRAFWQWQRRTGYVQDRGWQHREAAFARRPDRAPS